MPSRPQLTDYIHPAYNGVHLLAQPKTNASALYLIHSIIDYYNTQRGWSQMPPVPHNTMFHIVDLTSAEPDYIYTQLSLAFTVPEYYGFSPSVLFTQLTDLSWLNTGHTQLNHVLLLRAKTKLITAAASQVLSEVAAFWKTKNTAFLVFIAETAVAEHGFPERFRL